MENGVVIETFVRYADESQNPNVYMETMEASNNKAVIWALNKERLINSGF